MSANEKTIEYGPILMNLDAHNVTVDGKDIILTALEFKLLKHLLKRRGRVQTRDQLLADVWGLSSEVTTRTVDTHIKRLREKLDKTGNLIQTIRGVGYRFNNHT
jgi:two-component system phosphate regulon response regulator PhoB